MSEDNNEEPTNEELIAAMPVTVMDGDGLKLKDEKWIVRMFSGGMLAVAVLSGDYTSAIVIAVVLLVLFVTFKWRYAYLNRIYSGGRGKKVCVRILGKKPVGKYLQYTAEIISHDYNGKEVLFGGLQMHGFYFWKDVSLKLGERVAGYYSPEAPGTLYAARVTDVSHLRDVAVTSSVHRG